MVSARVILFALIALLAAFAGGWYVCDRHWVASVAKSEGKVRAAALDRERELQATADKLKEAKDAEIRSINARLAAALAELRKRPTSPSGGQAAEPVNPKGWCTGAQLYADHAAVLIREATRADEIRVTLQQCIAQYEEAQGHGRR